MRICIHNFYINFCNTIFTWSARFAICICYTQAPPQSVSKPSYPTRISTFFTVPQIKTTLRPTTTLLSTLNFTCISKIEEIRFTFPWFQHKQQCSARQRSCTLCTRCNDIRKTALHSYTHALAFLGNWKKKKQNSYKISLKRHHTLLLSRIPSLHCFLFECIDASVKHTVLSFKSFC